MLCLGNLSEIVGSHSAYFVVPGVICHVPNNCCWLIVATPYDNICELTVIITPGKGLPPNGTMLTNQQ